MGQLFDILATALLIFTFACAAPMMTIAIIAGAV